MTPFYHCLCVFSLAVREIRVALRELVSGLGFVRTNVVQASKLEGEALERLKFQVRMWVRGLFVQNKSHEAFYKFTWTEKEAANLEEFHRAMLSNLHANYVVNSRMVRPFCSCLFFPQSKVGW